MSIKKFNTNVSKILHLVINSIYTNKDIFLRELISNASDACEKMRYLSISKPNLLTKNHEFYIQISFDKECKTITIEDSGIGMNEKDLNHYLGTIAQSSVKNFQANIIQNKKNNISLIGQFGIGFYSAFMVSDKVHVISKKAEEEFSYQWISNGYESYSITKFLGNSKQGTKIILHIKDDCHQFLNKYKLENIIKTYSDHVSFPIKIITDGKHEITNKVTALWIKNPKDISEKEYIQFYTHISHQHDKPWLTIHNKIEGTLEYSNLIFIPEEKPIDLFHPNRKTNIKLYVNRIMISDKDNHLIPTYLRFLRGVVDSSDLPLNINRETLQKNNIITKIRFAITKKILTRIIEKADQEPKSFIKFINNFGETIKEGLCSECSTYEKEKILDICRFYSSSSEKKLISLKEYVLSMVEGQDKIYYFNGNNIDSMRKNPQLEGFKKRGIKVLLLTDHVDNIWINTINKYQEKEFVGITTSSINLDKIKKIDKEDKNIDNKKNTEVYDKLIIEIKNTLNTKIKNVIISSKLINSPACLSSPEGLMNIKMEKFLIQQKQLKHKSARIFEINPSHSIWQNINKSISLNNNCNNEKKIRNDLIHVIYYQAILVEEDNIDNLNQFTEQINHLLSLIKITK